MILFTIQYTNALLLLLSLAFSLPAATAAKGSGIARSSGDKRSTGFRILSDELTPDFIKRQVVCPSSAPLCGAACCATTCSAGVCVSSVPPTTTAVQGTTTTTTQPASSSGSTSSSASSTLQNPSSSSSVASSPDSSSSSSSQSDPSQSPGSSSNSSSTSSVGSSITDPASPAPSESIGNGTAPASSESIGNGTATSTSLSDSVSGGSTTTGGGSSSGASPTGSLSQNGTGLPSSSSSISYSLSYEFGTVTGPGGSESISIGTYSVSAVVPITSDTALSSAPLVVQQALPDAPPTPVCQLQYLPGDAWESTGDTSTTNTTSGPAPPHQGIVRGQCNNGTRVSNKVGSQIHLKFTGTEVSLLMIPGMYGGAYDVKLDDEDVETLDNYKADSTSCEVTTPWARSGLDNKPHDITVIVKGSAAGTAGGSQVEFNGLIFKGPKTTADTSGPNWVIIGASIGAGVVVLALIFILFLCLRRRRAQRAATTTADPRAPSTDPSFRPQTMVSGHTRAGSTFSGVTTGGVVQTGPLTGHHRADSSLSNTPSGHYRGDSGLSGAPYSPTSPLSALQQNPYGQNPYGHTRTQSDAPLMMQQGQQQPWQIPVGAMAPMANVPPSGSPYHSNMSSPQSRPMTLDGYNNGQGQQHQSITGYGNGQERQSMVAYGNGQERQSVVGYGNPQGRQSFAQTHGRSTSYASEARNPFE